MQDKIEKTKQGPQRLSETRKKELTAMVLPHCNMAEVQYVMKECSDGLKRATIEKVTNQIAEFVNNEKRAELVTKMLEKIQGYGREIQVLDRHKAPEEIRIVTPIDGLKRLEDIVGPEEVDQILEMENLDKLLRLTFCKIDDFGEGKGFVAIEAMKKEAPQGEKVLLNLLKATEKAQEGENMEKLWEQLLYGFEYDNNKTTYQAMQSIIIGIKKDIDLKVITKWLEEGSTRIDFQTSGIQEEQTKKVLERISSDQEEKGMDAIKGEEYKKEYLRIALQTGSKKSVLSKEGPASIAREISNKLKQDKESAEYKEMRGMLKEYLVEIQQGSDEEGGDQRSVWSWIQKEAPVTKEIYEEVLQEILDEYKKLPEYYTNEDRTRTRGLIKRIKETREDKSLDKLKEKIDSLDEQFKEKLKESPLVPQEVKAVYLGEHETIKTNSFKYILQWLAAYQITIIEKEGKYLKMEDMIEEGHVQEQLEKMTERFFELYELEIPLYEKLAEEMDDEQKEKALLEIYFGRDGDMAYAGRDAQRATRRKAEKEDKDVLAIDPRYLIFNRPMSGYWQKETLEQFFREQGVFKKEEVKEGTVDYQTFDTGFIGSIPVAFLEALGYDEEEIDERIKLLYSRFSKKRRADFLEHNIEARNIDLIEEREKKVRSAEGYVVDEKTGKIKLVEKPTSGTEQAMSLFMHQIIRRHFYIREKERIENLKQ